MSSADAKIDQNKPESDAGYKAKAAPGWLVSRTADKQAAFFLPYLQPGHS